MEKEKKRKAKNSRLEISPAYLTDRGGRRLGLDRRRFSYSAHIPERRSGEERRKSRDRRRKIDWSLLLDRMRDQERRAAFLRLREGVESGGLDIIIPQEEESDNNQGIGGSSEPRDT